MKYPQSVGICSIDNILCTEHGTDLGDWSKPEYLSFDDCQNQKTLDLTYMNIETVPQFYFMYRMFHV